MMSNLTIIYMDYNNDIKELLQILTTIVPVKGSISEGYDAWSPKYTFESTLWDARMTLHENSVYDEESIYCICRFYMGIKGNDEYECLLELTSKLRERNDITFDVRELPHIPDFDYHPISFKPDFSIITRQMPAIIMIKTRLKNKQLKTELRNITALSTWEIGADCPDLGVSYTFCELEGWWRQEEYRGYYGGFQASHRIQIFSAENDPAKRRPLRDSFALSLYEKIKVSDKLEARLYEIANGKVRTFGSVSDD